MQKTSISKNATFRKLKK